MNADDKLPALRPVEISTREHEGQVYFVLHDRARISPHSLSLSPAGYFVLAHLDGRHSCADIQAAFRRHVGAVLPANQILKLVRALDEALMLQGERYEQAYARRRDAYLAAPARDNRDRYPDGATLRREIEAILAQGVAAAVTEVRGLIAPHLDYGRGAPCYADAYATLARAPRADRYVILGTDHFGRSGSVVATIKDFQTPLGIARTDRAAVEAIEQHLGRCIREEETDHLWEHSIELQVHFLQVISDAKDFQIVPVLCPSACEPSDDRSQSAIRTELDEFAGALSAIVAGCDRRTVIIAAADLSHVGRHFGDPGPSTPEFLETVASFDRQMLGLLEARGEEEFVERLCATGNATRVCSSGCIYGLLRALPRRPCRVLRYHQAVNFEAETHVTCAAAVVC